MKFEYEALDGDGKMVRGTIDAEDFKSVIRQLVEKRLYPIGVSNLTPGGIEIDRLKKFRNRLKPRPKGLGPKPLSGPRPPTGKESKIDVDYSRFRSKKDRQFDWTYLAFALMILAIITGAVVQLHPELLQRLNQQTESHQYNGR